MNNNIFHNHILIVSHWRSGTHLTLDLIRNNSKIYRLPYISLRKYDMSVDYQKEFDYQIFSLPSVFKSHSDINFNSFYNDIYTTEILNLLVKQSKIIYIHRDGRDVLTSLYYYLKSDNNSKQISFSDFLLTKNDLDSQLSHSHKNRIEYWLYHRQSWVEYLSNRNNSLIIRYEDIINNYNDTVKNIMNFLGEPVFDCNIVDIRMTEKKQSNTNIITSSKFRKGMIGDYANHFTEKDYKIFNDTKISF